ncbi:MAG: NAD(P)-binding protein [Pyrinomonadaceae bacterium]|jgi:phytoene dehydrogenase-like protein|nr:NAD(P)-binding protein [Pyrinomonadaceae bacterium]
MTHEIVVVGGGIGGLTVSALLAARGFDVCLLERQSRPGGSIAGFEKFGYTFDPGIGLYPLWQAGEIHDQVFSELPVAAPEVFAADPAYLVRLPDQSEVPITANTEQFEASLVATFPECADSAVSFYQESAVVSEALRSALRRVPNLHAAGSMKQIYALLPDIVNAGRIIKARNHTTLDHLEGTSFRFRRFIDTQLQLLAQATSQECEYLYASLALNIPRRGNFSIRGGAPALAQKLAGSIKASGGRIRFDTPALRLAYDAAGRAIGVDLLRGERVSASRAIVSNLTLWDTYGKLIGLNHTPSEIRKSLNNLRTWGVYLLYLGMSEAAASRIPNNRILAVTDWQEHVDYDPEVSQFMFAAAPAEDRRAPEGKRAVTVLTFSDVDQWFTFQENEEQNEEKDQSVLEVWWRRLHEALPELGGDIEVIDTATPRTIYDMTRRKLGMVGGLAKMREPPDADLLNYQTSLPNLFRVGDTASLGGSIAAVTHAAKSLADRLSA